MNHIRKNFIGLDNAKADYKKEYNEDYDIF